MAGKRTVDIKLSFEQYDMMPGPGGKKFMRNLFLYGGTADTQGFSYTDCFLRIDDFAVVNGAAITLPAPAGAVAAPGAGVPVPPAGNAGQQAVALAQQYAARKARLKQSFSFLCSHISDSSTLELLADPTSPLFHNGPDAYDWIMLQVIKPPSTGDLQDMQIEFWLIEIITDIGITANSITDSVKMLRVVNAEFPIARRFNDDQMAEKLLSMIEHGSKMFALEAKKELDAVEGVPGVPGVRQFQLAAPAAGGARPRDLNGIIVFWQGQWEAAVKSKALPAAPATGQAGKLRRRHQADGANVATEHAFALGDGPVAPATREGSPSRTLGELTDAGFSLTRGTVTTSDWRLVGRSELARSAIDGDGGDQFSVECCYDADDTASIEILCNCCGGAGHPARLCPSAKKFRSHSYMVALHTNAGKRKDDNGLTKYGANVGGRRPPPRGQRPPFKPMPRRHSATTPFRRFEPGTPRPTRGQLQAARELLERELEHGLEHEEGEAERAEAVVETKPELVVTDIARVVTPSAPRASEHMPESSTLALQEREVLMPSVFSIDDFYCEVGFGASEVVTVPEEDCYPCRGIGHPPGPELEPLTIGALPTSVLARVVGHAADADLFALCEVSRGFQLAVLEHVDDVYAAEDRARAGDHFGSASSHFDDSEPSTATDTDDEVDEVDEATPRPRSHGLYHAMIALGAAVLACLVMWLSTARLALAKLGEMLTDATVTLPAGAVMVIIILLLSTRAGAAEQLPYDRAAIAQPGHVFDSVERCTPLVERAYELREKAPMGDYRVCMDSGCTCYCIPVEDKWMLDEVTDSKPNIGVEVASDAVLRVESVGLINSKHPPKLVCDSFMIKDGVRYATVSAPPMTRVLVTRGLKKTTRLGGVRPARVLDKWFAYFNDDNAAGIADCVRFPDGAYTLFDGTRHEIIFRVPSATDLQTYLRSEVANVGNSSRTREPVEIHCSLGHCSDRRIRSSQIVMHGVDLRCFYFDAAQCRGCRLGKTQEADTRVATAPSRGPPLAGRGTVPRPSTSGYERFGQRMDTDICTKMPTSWPHGFTAMANFCDRYSAEFFLSFLVDRSSSEIASSMEDIGRRIKHRLPTGFIERWHTDNETGFDGPEVKAVAEDLIERHTKTVPNAVNKNPVAERNFGTLEPGIRAALAYANAPECLWPWVGAHLERILHFMPTRAHEPPKSAHQFLHPETREVDLSWARPLFCDVTVHLTDRDIKTKTGPTGAEGCYLGRDLVRNCELVYVPSLRRLGSFTVTSWQPDSFDMCKRITSDTPVEYHQVDDLRFGPATAALLPRQMRAARQQAVAALAAKEEGAHAVSAAGSALKEALAETLATNAKHIEDGVKRLEKEGVTAFVTEVVKNVTAPPSPLEADILFNAQDDHSAEVEIVLDGNDVARKVAAQYGIPAIKTMREAMASKYWPLIREGMEEEIAGKLANEAFLVVPRPHSHVMKSKWVIDFKLGPDGSILKVKCRFVGCGYSQVEGKDYDKTYAATLPGCCLRLWCSIVADENLETDSIDAVKAFTQSDVDRELHVEMPIGFAIPGYVLLLRKALEGIKQGSYLWFQKNKAAWNQCGLFADLVEPNLYTHKTLPIIAAVFADDVGAAFAEDVRADYLKIRGAYAKLIKIDCLGPETILPVTKFTGVDISRDRAAGTLTISMGTYIRKLHDRRKTVITRDMPTGKSKALRQGFENLERGTEETTVDRVGYLEALGEISWPAAMAWPEMCFYSSSLGQYSQFPTQAHHDAVLYAMGYLFSDPDRGITYGGTLKIPYGLQAFPPYFNESRGLFAYTDSSWGTKPRPHGGHVVMRCNGAILWSAKTLKVVTDSTAHAETAEASRATKSVVFLRMGLEGIHRPAAGPTAILGDNSAMAELVNKEGASSRTRHFERATVLIKYAVLQLIVAVHLIGTKFMCADIFTKATDELTFKTMRSMIRNEPSTDGYAIRAARWISTLARVASPV